VINVDKPWLRPGPMTLVMVAACVAGGLWLVRGAFTEAPPELRLLQAQAGGGFPPADGRQLPAVPSAAQPLARRTGDAGCLPGGPVTRGSWALQPGGGLKPGEDLRERFEGYLDRGDGATRQELRDCLLQSAQHDGGPQAAAEVAGLWDRYLQVRNYNWQHRLNPNDPSTWAAAFEERGRVRRALLGPAWADAFYATEDRVLRQVLGAPAGPAPGVTEAIVGNGLNPPADPAGLHARRVAVLGEFAARELQAADARRALRRQQPQAEEPERPFDQDGDGPLREPPPAPPRR
jgi:hypothetical protein